MTQYTIGVRALCEFTARRGDLHFRFTPSPTAQQGMAGHATVAARRGPDYVRELKLEGEYQSLKVRGRADGFDAARNRLEEFKTHRGELDLMPANQRDLHWAQLKVYGALACAQRALPEVELVLVYFDIRSETETVVEERWRADDLRAFFRAQCAAFLDWAARELAHLGRRERFLDAVTFPHPELRAGQRHMAEQIYRAATRGAAAMVQAPTGIGKTIGTLFPVLKAARARFDKVFFLVAKTSGRGAPLEALRELLARQPDAAALRVLELASKDSACVYPGRSCDGDACPLARGFYDRLPAARTAAVDAGDLSQAALRGIAREHAVCPYYLTMDLATWSDVVVGDYNYFFDANALLHALTTQNQWRVAVLVDEAHNLLPRAREMYSATLKPAVLAAAMQIAPAPLRRHLAQVERAWVDWSDATPADYVVVQSIAPGVLSSLQRAVAALGEHADATALDGALLEFHFNALYFLKLAEALGPHSIVDLTREGNSSRVCIRNVSPAPFLAPRFGACACVILFSATLSPETYYRQLLGLPEAAAWIDVESPFAQHQLRVNVGRISTRYRDRERSLEPIAELMSRQYAAQPGNYLAFFGSFAYLEAALAVFRRHCPDVPVWEQVRGMDAGARGQFLARFSTSSRGIGFAVLGGVFAEGVDLPGTRLIGAFIATLGLPQVNDVNAEIERRLQTLFDAGYEYTYLYPGLQKVVQAAGRVIRTLSDRGTVHLMDDRFQNAAIQRLLPRWWQLQCQ